MSESWTVLCNGRSNNSYVHILLMPIAWKQQLPRKGSHSYCNLRDEIIWQQNNKQEIQMCHLWAKMVSICSKTQLKEEQRYFLQGSNSYRWWQILVVVTSRSNKDGQWRNQRLFESGNCGTETGLLKKSRWSKEDCGNLRVVKQKLACWKEPR